MIRRRGNKEENSFTDPETNEEIQFPSMDAQASINLSVIVPAYFEEERCNVLYFFNSLNDLVLISPCFTVPPMLEECLKFLEAKSKNSKFKYEVIIVNDGSTDGTSAVASKYMKSHGVDKVRLLNLTENRGKGGAVRLVCLLSFVFSIY
jgi:dolichyl-phosphate beta-glucosyltransferase